MKTAHILRAARGRIENPKYWTQGVGAHDIHGKKVSPENEAAVRWCALGALLWTATEDSKGYVEALRALAKAIDSTIHGFLHEEHAINTITDFNDDDTTDHEDILGAFDLAIRAQEEA